MYLEKLRLDGRVAVVTGAAPGIGHAAAKRCANEVWLRAVDVNLNSVFRCCRLR